MAENMISIIVPTYNERDNILPLVERLSRTLAGHNFEILLVDDSSNDGTIDTAAALAGKYPVKVLVRSNERGLATAVLHGLQYAKGDIIGVMDADLQHPPEINAALLKAIEDGADMAVASRYVQGGGCPNWGLTRRIISKGALSLAHLFLPSSRKLKDPMSGFFMFKREKIAGVVFKPIGYKILLEMLVMGQFEKVVEVPFIFNDRSSGRSKMKARQQIDYLKHIFSLMRRNGELKRFVKFCLVGLSGVVVNLGVFWIWATYTGLPKIVCSAIAIEISIITNFLLNDYYTFSDRRSGKSFSVFARLGKYNLISSPGGILNLIVFPILNSVLGVYFLLAQLIGIVVSILWNYLMNNFWTWK